MEVQDRTAEACRDWYATDDHPVVFNRYVPEIPFLMEQSMDQLPVGGYYDIRGGTDCVRTYSVETQHFANPDYGGILL